MKQIELKNQDAEYFYSCIKSDKLRTIKGNDYKTGDKIALKNNETGKYNLYLITQDYTKVDDNIEWIPDEADWFNFINEYGKDKGLFFVPTFDKYSEDVLIASHLLTVDVNSEMFLFYCKYYPKRLEDRTSVFMFYSLYWHYFVHNQMWNEEMGEWYDIIRK